MHNNNLLRKWQQLESESTDSFISLRLENCAANLYIAINNKSEKCLILELDQNITNFLDQVREHLSLTYFDLSKHLIITLHSPEFEDVFNSFIQNVIYNVADEHDNRAAAKSIIDTFFEWETFFSTKYASLSKAEIIGAFGEISFLLQCLSSLSPEYYLSILNSWTGPFGKSVDFDFPSEQYEIKTILASNNSVRISSEYQLEYVENKDLYLAVCKVTEESDEAISIAQLIGKVKELLVYQTDCQKIFRHCLNKLGLFETIIMKLNHPRLHVINFIYYNTMVEGFPRIIRSQLSPSITEVKYSLNLKDLILYQEPKMPFKWK